MNSLDIDLSSYALTHFRWWRDAALGQPTPPSSQIWIENGVVKSVGPLLEMPESIPRIDLENRILMPKFIDSHCHILPTGLSLLALDLSDCHSQEATLDKIRDHAKQTEHSQNPWIICVQYDQNRFEGTQHLTSQQLDTISSTRPIYLRHSNGHCSVANSELLRIAEVDETTSNPFGGEYVRDASGKLTGLLLEEAHEKVSSYLPVPSFEEMVQAILMAGDKMSEFGIGTATDMMTGDENLELELRAYQEAARRGCKIRSRLYVQWNAVFGPQGVGVERFRELITELDDSDQVKVCGIKLFADGAIGSATAAIYGDYLTQAPSSKVTASGQKWSGQLMHTPERLIEMTKVASDAGFPVAIHAIGDYASDLVMDAFEASGCPERHRLEHAMILGDAQIQRLSKLNCSVTLQPEFLMRFSRSYLKQLGTEMTYSLKRARSLIDAGLRVSFNSDRPIVTGNPWDGIRTAVQRSGDLDPTESITLTEAIDAYTIEGSRVNDDGDRQGCLHEGSLADWQALDRFPF